MDARITLDNGLINEHEFEEMYSGQSPLVWLNNAVTDSHFQQRDRMGRLEVFLGRLDADGLNDNVFGIGINEQTALLVEQNGLSRVVGNAYSRKTPISEQLRSVYFLDATSSISSLLTQSDLRDSQCWLQKVCTNGGVQREL